jgi:hypothetical protein
MRNIIELLSDTNENISKEEKIQNILNLLRKMKETIIDLKLDADGWLSEEWVIIDCNELIEELEKIQRTNNKEEQ